MRVFSKTQFVIAASEPQSPQIPRGMAGQARHDVEVRFLERNFNACNCNALEFSRILVEILEVSYLSWELRG